MTEEESLVLLVTVLRSHLSLTMDLSELMDKYTPPEERTKRAQAMLRDLYDQARQRLDALKP
jgi:hypothetical protein